MNLIKIGTTGYRDEIYIVQATGANAGQPYTGLSFNTAGLTAFYYRNTATGLVDFALNSGTLGNWRTGGFVEVATGTYQVGLPDGAFASGADNVIFTYYGVANMLAVPLK